MALPPDNTAPSTSKARQIRDSNPGTPQACPANAILQAFPVTCNLRRFYFNQCQSVSLMSATRSWRCALLRWIHVKVASPSSHTEAEDAEWGFFTVEREREHVSNVPVCREHARETERERERRLTKEIWENKADQTHIHHSRIQACAHTHTHTHTLSLFHIHTLGHHNRSVFVGLTVIRHHTMKLCLTVLQFKCLSNMIGQCLIWTIWLASV